MSRIYGPSAVAELLATDPAALALVVVARGRLTEADAALLAEARAAGVEVREVDPAELRSRSGGRGGARLGADVRVAGAPDVGDLVAAPGEDALVLALDGVTDPHNLGAIVRTAGAFGARAVLVPRDRAAPLNDAAVRASAGAVAWVPVVRVVNLARALRQLAEQGWWTVATLVDAERTVWEADLCGPVALALGAEGRGLRPGVARACDLSVGLPLPGRVGSLNVSVFAGVACAEVARQRRARGAAEGPQSP